MSTAARFSSVQRLVLVALSLVLLLWSPIASAAGRVEWKSKQFKEREGGSWRLELAIYLPAAPDVAHVPMRFEFKPTAYYDRSMVDGDKLVEQTIPLSDKQSLIESVDVGFLDSATGKIEKRTRFTFKVTRAHGYEAGEYRVTIRDGRTRNTVGATVTLKLQGDNPVIDRRAMVFTGEKKKKKKDEPAAASEKTDEAEGAAEAKSEESSGTAADPGDAADESMDAEALSEEPDGPPPIEKKPGGCGCRVKPSSFGGEAWFVLALALGAGLRRRRPTP